ASILALRKNRHGRGASERLLTSLGYPRDDALSRDGVGDEDDPTLVTRDTDAAVRDAGHIEFEEVAGRENRAGGVNHMPHSLTLLARVGRSLLLALGGVN